MGKPIQWLGPWDSIKNDAKKIKKNCVIWSEKNEGLLKKFESSVPEKVALFSFITNPRGVPMPIGSELFGYENVEYLSWWQNIAQELWADINEKFSQINCPVVSIKEAADVGFYDDDSLPEQFPGDEVSLGNPFHDYPVGKFNERDFGGWKWFGLIVDGENWNGKWTQEPIPKLEPKQKLYQEAAPKYYKSYTFKNNKLEEDTKSKELYARPAGVRLINRRFCWPWISSIKAESKAALRYEKASKIIMQRLGTMWTLAVWNSFECSYSTSKNGPSIEVKPEIILSIGRFSESLDGQKEWGKPFAHLQKHWEGLYKVKVGLSDKTKLKLEPQIKKETNPYWDGTPAKLLNEIYEPYEKLLDLAIDNLRDLF